MYKHLSLLYRRAESVEERNQALFANNLSGISLTVDDIASFFYPEGDPSVAADSN